MASVHPDDRARALDAQGRCHLGGSPFELDLHVGDASGAFRQLVARGCLQDDRCVTVAVDVTERAERERKQEQAIRSLRSDAARLGALQSLTAALAALHEPNRVAEVVINRGAVELGASTASLCLLAGDGETLELAAHVGYPEAVLDGWRSFPVEAATPAGDAVRLQTGIFVGSLDELYRRYPVFQGTAVVGDEATAVLPLATPTTGPLGVMVFGFARARAFDAGDRRLLDALAVQASTALSRSRARAALEAAQAQLTFLADASAQLSASLDVEQTLQTVGQLAVPGVADRCGLYLLDHGQVTARFWAPHDPADLVDVVTRYRVSTADPTGVGAVLRTGTTCFVPLFDHAALAALAGDEERYQRLQDLGLGGAVVIPMRARGRLIGALALVNQRTRPMAELDVALAEELAARAAVAIDNAALYADQVNLAHRLQASLLPPTLPSIKGLDLGARYAPATADVGGDFYDLIQVSPNRLLLVVGDVKGKGVDAAVLTGLVRHAVRAVAGTERRPSAVLTELNRVLLDHDKERIAASAEDNPAVVPWEVDEPRFCTMCAVSLTPAGASFQAVVASAGHPLPLVRAPEGTVVPLGQAGTMLGVLPTIDLPEMTVQLDPGSVMLCYTDGVSESHNGRRFFDEDGVMSVLEVATGSADKVAEEVLRAARMFTPAGEIRDDLAILAVRVDYGAE